MKFMKVFLTHIILFWWGRPCKQRFKNPMAPDMESTGLLIWCKTPGDQDCSEPNVAEIPKALEGLKCG